MSGVHRVLRCALMLPLFILLLTVCGAGVVSADTQYFRYGGILTEHADGSGEKQIVSAGEAAEVLEADEKQATVLYGGRQWYMADPAFDDAPVDPGDDETDFQNALSGLPKFRAERGDGALIAHKGFCAGAPENSLAAFYEAGKRGYFGIETDVQWTIDSVLICFHDASLDALTTGSGRVTNSAWTAISGVTYRQAAAEEYGVQGISLFSDYLEICRQYGCTAVIDLKSVPDGGDFCRAVLQAVTDAGMLGSAVYQCDMPEYLQVIRDASAEARLWYLRHGQFTQGEIEAAAALRCECMNADVWTEEAVSTVQSFGMDTCMYTAESEERRTALCAMGLNYIMTDGYIAP